MATYNFECPHCGHHEGFWLSFCCACKKERISGEETQLWNTSACGNPKKPEKKNGGAK